MLLVQYVLGIKYVGPKRSEGRIFLQVKNIFNISVAPYQIHTGSPSSHLGDILYEAGELFLYYLEAMIPD